MAVDPNSYGTPTEVAALTRRYTTNGTYDITTNPTLETVEGWIDSVSATLNVLLAEVGFAVPVTQATAKKALAGIVVEAVADLCHAANSAGRFFTDRMLERGKSPMQIIRVEMADWVQEHAAGLEAVGVARGGGAADSGRIVFRNGDEAGNAVDPLFQRNAFGERSRNWDQ
ncbi:MAG TPA: hypothetical protein VIH16_03815 [Bellilinea sp.]